MRRARSWLPQEPSDPVIDLDAISRAHSRIRAHIHHTPVLSSASLSEIVGAELLFKCENLQRCGAFKARGALNAVLSLADAEACRGVATHSSGNHGAALAMAAQVRGIAAHVVMPSDAPAVKKAAVEGYGGRVVECEPSLDARRDGLDVVVAETQAIFVPPYDDDRIIAGQGTAAVELLDDAGPLDQMWMPVGGGGLAAGSAVVAAASGVHVIAGEPANADDAYRSMASGRIEPVAPTVTMADGLRTGLGERNFEILQRCGVEVALASETGIQQAMRLVWEQLKVIIELSSAVPLAAMLENPGRARGRVGVILTGGNVDLDRFFGKAARAT